MSKPVRFVALYDIHAGWEKIYRSGELVTVPTHNLPAIRCALRFVEDFAPDVVLLGGDQLNCGPVSHWNNGKPRIIEGLRVKAECDLLFDTVLEPLAPVGRKIFHLGNHEFWIYDFVNTHPALEGLVEPHNYLSLADHGWEVKDFNAWTHLGKLHFAHGDNFLRRGKREAALLKAVTWHNKNIRVGHGHSYCVVPQTTPIERGDVHTAVMVPCLSTRAPEYNKDNPNDFMNGFLYGEVWPDGNFNDHVMVITAGKCRWNGKLYDGNKR